MNILIVGGLLLLAVVAIVGAVLLGMGEERAEKQRKEERATPSGQTSPLSSQAPEAALPTATPSSTTRSGVLSPETYETASSTRSGVLAPATYEAPSSPTRSGVLAPATPQVSSSPLPGTFTSGNLRTTRQLAPSLHEEAHPSAYNSGQFAVPREEAHPSAYNSGQFAVPREEAHPSAYNSGQFAVPREEAHPSAYNSGQFAVPREEAHPSAYNSGQFAVPREEAHPSVYNSGQFAVPREDAHVVILNSQVQAIAGELRTLAQKANELEQRLSTLSEVLESQPRSQNDMTGKTSVFRKIEISSF